MIIVTPANGIGQHDCDGQRLVCPGRRIDCGHNAAAHLGGGLARKRDRKQFFGLLDPQGRAQAQFTLPALAIPPALVGMRLEFAVVGPDTTGFWSGGPALLEVLP